MIASDQATVDQVIRFAGRLDTCFRSLLGFALDDLPTDVSARLVAAMATPNPVAMDLYRRIAAKADGLLADHGDQLADLADELRACCGTLVVLQTINTVFLQMMDQLSDTHLQALVDVLRRQHRLLDELDRRCGLASSRPTLRVIQGGRTS